MHQSSIFSFEILELPLLYIAIFLCEHFSTRKAISFTIQHNLYIFYSSFCLPFLLIATLETARGLTVASTLDTQTWIGSTHELDWVRNFPVHGGLGQKISTDNGLGNCKCISVGWVGSSDPLVFVDRVGSESRRVGF